MMTSLKMPEYEGISDSVKNIEEVTKLLLEEIANSKDFNSSEEILKEFDRTMEELGVEMCKKGLKIIFEEDYKNIPKNEFITEFKKYAKNTLVEFDYDFKTKDVDFYEEDMNDILLHYRNLYLKLENLEQDRSESLTLDQKIDIKFDYDNFYNLVYEAIEMENFMNFL